MTCCVSHDFVHYFSVHWRLVHGGTFARIPRLVDVQHGPCHQGYRGQDASAIHCSRVCVVKVVSILLFEN